MKATTVRCNVLENNKKLTLLTWKIRKNTLKRVYDVINDVIMREKCQNCIVHSITFRLICYLTISHQVRFLYSAPHGVSGYDVIAHFPHSSDRVSGHFWTLQGHYYHPLKYFCSTMKCRRIELTPPTNTKSCCS